jgi:inorganic triphosphatase YgiF
MAKAKSVTGLDPQAQTSTNARILVRTRLEEMYNWSEYVDDPFEVKALHDLRIAAKRLRYTLELFEDVLPEASKSAVKELEQIQDELGALHDSDVIIALLRLCLGSQDSGTVYEQALSRTQNYQGKQKTLAQPELVAELENPDVTPSAEERYGLEQLLDKQQHKREEQYQAFRQHWYQLQAQDFRRHLLGILEREPVTS